MVLYGFVHGGYAVGVLPLYPVEQLHQQRVRGQAQPHDAGDVTAYPKMFEVGVVVGAAEDYAVEGCHTTFGAVEREPLQRGHASGSSPAPFVAAAVRDVVDALAVDAGVEAHPAKRVVARKPRIGCGTPRVVYGIARAETIYARLALCPNQATGSVH